jgi:hypothetical protein
MEGLNDAFFWVEICKNKKRKLDDMIFAYERDPSISLLD